MSRWCWRRWAEIAKLLLLTSTFSSVSFAFCRQRSCNDDLPGAQPCERDAAGCVTEGRELSRDTHCLSFAIAYGGGESVGLGDGPFEALVNQAFQAWASVDCGDGQPPGFIVQSSGIVESREPLFCAAAADRNVNVFFFVSNWMYPQSTLGYTHTSYLPGMGTILDADVELNADYVMRAPEAERQAVLAAVTQHEVGHFLGLGHSDDPGAVMAATYDPSRQLLPQFTQDDIDGICAIFPPSRRPNECATPNLDVAGLDPAECKPEAAPQADAGCNLGAGAATGVSPLLLLGALSVLGVAYRRKRAN